MYPDMTYIWRLMFEKYYYRIKIWVIDGKWRRNTLIYLKISRFFTYDNDIFFSKVESKIILLRIFFGRVSSSHVVSSFSWTLDLCFTEFYFEFLSCVGKLWINNLNFIFFTMAFGEISMWTKNYQMSIKWPKSKNSHFSFNKLHSTYHVPFWT